MSTARHENGDSPFADNLDRDPEIGQSKGTTATGEHPQAIKGESTTEGDVDNDSTPTGGVFERERGRTNE